MAKKPTYEELQQRVKELENEALERKRVYEALWKSEEKYRDIFNNAQVGIFRTRISDGKVLECKDHFVVSEYYTDPGAREKMVAFLMEEGEVNPNVA